MVALHVCQVWWTLAYRERGVINLGAHSAKVELCARASIRLTCFAGTCQILVDLVEESGLRFGPQLYADTQIISVCQRKVVDVSSFLSSGEQKPYITCIWFLLSGRHPGFTEQSNRVHQRRWQVDGANRLQLNAAKTEVLWCASNRQQHLVPTVPIDPFSVCGDTVKPAKSVRNLGIFLDSDMSMKTHVSRTVSSCFAALRQIRSIIRSVSQPLERTAYSSIRPKTAVQKRPITVPVWGGLRRPLGGGGLGPPSPSLVTSLMTVKTRTTWYT